ncbi:nuclear transcription factor Y subunit alpha-like [Octopus vulgaris]|uniref:Nuclear transcription factor Y subunit alpha-like n=3 Tax=Octopus TaxID=6643 RepID=A0AA36BG52_OCTVU|nr:nuclear transcription factor Y subunit alpha isoform X1 [Octopus sinensis]CAI9733047.1 nuclear transcription factor Y subunit alpha-like [Octopus vulgaris]
MIAMAEGETYTVFDSDTHQPLTVTVNPEEGHSSIQYITPDGTPLTSLNQTQAAEIVHVTESQNAVYTTIPNSTYVATPASSQTAIANTAVPLVVQSSNGVQMQNVQVQQAIVQQQSQQGSNVIQAQSVVQNNVSNVAGSGLPQMLFLNQVNVNGQPSLVLVDSNNKPVQLPQGIQVINLPTQQIAGQQLPMVSPGETGEEPLYVNAKQYHRILKRRQARAKLEALGKIPKERRKYLYESRHRHAINRQRGQGGVFVSGPRKDPSPINHSHGAANGSSHIQPTETRYREIAAATCSPSSGHPSDLLSSLTT